MISTWIRSLVALAMIAGAAVPAVAQRGRVGAPPATPRGPSRIERATIAGADVTVYLPPSYADDAARRFPAVYLITERPIDAVQVAGDKLAAAPGFSEPIVVMADAAAADSLSALVPEVDRKYRTIAARISRGLVGSSLGGDGALRAAMKSPDVFSSLYLLNASVVDATVASVDGNAAALQRYYSVSISVGAADAGLAMNRRLHDAMTRLRIPHYYEEYDARAVSIAERVETRLLPFFSKNLKAPANPTSPAVE